jgi:hypothetical protein
VAGRTASGCEEKARRFRLRPPPGFERLEALVAAQCHMPEVVEAGTAERPVREVEAGGQDEFDRHGEAGREAQHGAGVLRGAGQRRALRGDSATICC